MPVGALAFCNTQEGSPGIWRSTAQGCRVLAQQLMHRLRGVIELLASVPELAL